VWPRAKISGLYKDFLRGKNMTSIKVLMSGVGVAALSIGWTPFVHPAAAQQGGKALVLEEIIVTARKREEALLDVPMSITALSKDQLEKLNVQDMTEISKLTPGMYFSDYGSNRADRYSNQFVVRGLAVNNFANFSNAAILFVDGVPIASSNIPGTLDIERVEILKGPQTAQFGRNTFSGAISVTTRQPTNEWDARALAEYATYDSSQVALAVSGPIIEDKVLFRISGEHRNRGGQYQNVLDGTSLGGQTTSSISGKLKFTPTDSLEIGLSGNYYEYQDEHGAQYRLNKADHNCDPGKTGAPTYFCGKAPAPDASRLNYLLIDQRWKDLILPRAYFKPPLATKPGLTSENVHLSGTIAYTFPNNWLFEATTGYDKTNAGTINNEYYNPNVRNRLATPANGARTDVFSWLYNLNRYFKDFSQEVRLSSESDSRLRWTLGGNYVKFDGASEVNGDVALGALTLLPGSRREVATWSGFGGMYYDVLENLEFGVEARYQTDKADDTPRYFANLTGQPNLSGKWNAFTPRVTVNYKPTEDITLYALWARGNRPGAFNAALAPGANLPGTQAAIVAQTGAKLAVDPEKIDTYDAGVKGRFLDGRGIATLGVYTGAITNSQISKGFVVATPSVLIGSAFVSQGKTSFKGVELDASFQVTEELTVSAAYALNDVKIKIGGDPSLLVISGGTTDGIGKRLAGTPKTSGNMTARYTSKLNDTYDWYVGGEFIYVGGKFATNANLVTTGAQKLVNARIGVENDDVRVEVWGKNILDDETIPDISRPFDYDSFQTVALGISMPQKPTFGVRMNYKF
jgi:iron complex outermembrane receptor protein